MSGTAGGRALFLAALAGALLFAALVSHGSSPAATATAAAGCKNSDKLAREIKPKQAEKSIICLINKERRSAGLKKVEKQGKLRKAARKHSKYENKNNCISHQCPGEAGFTQRLMNVGYPGCPCRWSAGETIGWRKGGGATPRGIVAAWLASSQHRGILLNPLYRDIGVGVVWGSPRAGSPKGIVAGIYTAILGYRS